MFFRNEITNNKFCLLLYFRDLASKLWQQAKLKYNTETLCDVILRDVVHPIPVIQQAGAQALAALLKDAPSHLTDTVLKKLLNIYHEKMAVSIIKICISQDFLISTVQLVKIKRANPNILKKISLQHQIILSTPHSMYTTYKKVTLL